ncbi:MAG: tRNA (N6-isopentenyl adenosine(37)-C2)-methylthiotransferase MiaB [Saprospiraceae bacterium]
MYNNNPSLEGIKVKLDINTSLEEERYDKVIELENNIAQKYFYIESYGCAMNFSDSEIVASILANEGYKSTKVMEESDLILINTCSIREKAEHNVRQRLSVFGKNKKKSALVGVLGCMAERLKKKFLEEERLVDIVVGPDAYRDLPSLIQVAIGGEKGVNVFLSKEETYADITPLRLGSNGVSGYISIMRGCDNMCSFCVVPFTRGRERSRNAFTIMAEAGHMVEQGYKEVVLLGQNVDSYKWINPESGDKVTFAQLLIMVAKINPILRVRFSTSHPKDINDEVLYAIRDHHNICNYIHLPVQSGNSRILDLMNRAYDREWYKSKIDRIKEIIPDCAISADIITGFCTETEEEHQDTLSILEYSNFSMIYTFYYSERPGTLAAKKFKDDIPLETKKKRLNDVIEVYSRIAHEVNQRDVGQTFEVLVDGTSKKSKLELRGRNSQNKVIIFPKKEGVKVGDYVKVKVHQASRATLRGIVDTTII